MPDPDRDRGDRYQSDAYRHNARDTRFAYRWNPDRFEGRFEGRRDLEREREMRFRGDARDYYDYGRNDYGRADYGRADYGRSDYGRPDYGRGDFGRSDYGYGRPYGANDYRDREYGRDFGGRDYNRVNRYRDVDDNYGADRGWDRGRMGSYYEGDMGGAGWEDRERDWRWRRGR